MQHNCPPGWLFKQKSRCLETVFGCFHQSTEMWKNHPMTPPHLRGSWCAEMAKPAASDLNGAKNENQALFCVNYQACEIVRLFVSKDGSVLLMDVFIFCVDALTSCWLTSLCGALTTSMPCRLWNFSTFWQCNSRKGHLRTTLMSSLNSRLHFWFDLKAQSR